MHALQLQRLVPPQRSVPQRTCENEASAASRLTTSFFLLSAMMGLPSSSFRACSKHQSEGGTTTVDNGGRVCNARCSVVTHPFRSDWVESTRLRCSSRHAAAPTR